MNLKSSGLGTLRHNAEASLVYAQHETESQDVDD